MSATTLPDLTVGSSIGEVRKQTGFDNWNRFAAVNYEFVPIHMDDEAGRAAGMPGAFGPGNMLITYLHALVRDWMGEHGCLTALSAQFRQPNTKGEIVLGGDVVSVDREGADTVVHLDIWARNAEGAPLTPGQAVVRFAT